MRNFVLQNANCSHVICLCQLRIIPETFFKARWYFTWLNSLFPVIKVKFKALLSIWVQKYESWPRKNMGLTWVKSINVHVCSWTGRVMKMTSPYKPFAKLLILVLLLVFRGTHTHLIPRWARAQNVNVGAWYEKKLTWKTLLIKYMIILSHHFSWWPWWLWLRFENYGKIALIEKLLWRGTSAWTSLLPSQLRLMADIYCKVMWHAHCPFKDNGHIVVTFAQLAVTH